MRARIIRSVEGESLELSFKPRPHYVDASTPEEWRAVVNAIMAAAGSADQEARITILIPLDTFSIVERVTGGPTVPSLDDTVTLKRTEWDLAKDAIEIVNFFEGEDRRLHRELGFQEDGFTVQSKGGYFHNRPTFREAALEAARDTRPADPMLKG